MRTSTTAALLAVAIAAAAGSASAKVPFMNATCPDGIEVHADEGGPVYINGHEAKLKKFSNSAYEASHGGVKIDLAKNPDGSLMVSYTGKHGANGICRVSGGHSGGGNTGGCPADVSEADRYKYPACN